MSAWGHHGICEWQQLKGDIRGMYCDKCRTPMKEIRGTVQFKNTGTTLQEKNVPMFQCPCCGQCSLSIEQSHRLLKTFPNVLLNLEIDKLIPNT